MIGIDGIRACCTVDRLPFQIPAGVPFSEAISLNGRLWTPGQTISLGFLNGTVTQRAKVKRWAETWLQYANLHFAWDAQRPNVRVAFSPGGSWSLIGTDCLMVPNGATIQFGWVTDASDDESDRAVIVHEFGHMLGLGHEQSNPKEDIQWNKPLAMQYYMSTQGWTAQMVQDNVFSVYQPNEVTGTDYDRRSVMQYPVPAQLTIDGKGIGWNTDADDVDKAYMRVMYPGVDQPKPVQPVSPIVVPPPSHPEEKLVVQIDKPAVHQPLPRTGPAIFGMDVPVKMDLLLSVVVDSAAGREPVLVVIPSGQPALHLGLVRGKGVFRFDPGHYQIQISNPIPKLTGEAWVKASTR